MLPFSSERYEQLRDHSLLLRLVSLRDLGPYTCQAYNGLGRADSWTVEIHSPGPLPGDVQPEDQEYLQFVVGSGVPRVTTSSTTTRAPPILTDQVPPPTRPREPTYIGTFLGKYMFPCFVWCPLNVTVLICVSLWRHSSIPCPSDVTLPCTFLT